MALPTSYDEAALAEYMVSVGVAPLADLGQSSADLGFPVRRALRAYGVSDIADATDMTKLEALAEYAIWDWIVSQYVTRYGISLDGERLDRQQLYEHAKDRLKDARAVAGSYGVGAAAVKMVNVIRDQDPYAVSSCTGDEFA